MSDSSPALRVLAFGGLEPALWGVGWFPEAADPGLTALGDGSARTALLDTVRLSAAKDDAEWRLEGGGGELTVAPAGAAVSAQAQEQTAAYDQLCRVSGAFGSDGERREVDCLGVRMWFPGPLELDRYESIRAVMSWFEPDEAFVLTALRARKAKGHDDDVVTGAVIGPERSMAAEDPRLSTTYAAEGWPMRAGLELWVADAEDPERQYPRRASGEASGPRLEATAAGMALRAEPFRWHSRGRDGAGMYILARPR